MAQSLSRLAIGIKVNNKGLIMTQFDIKRDIEIENSGGFWCHGCLIGKLADEQSDDPRYCCDCYKFLLTESTLLPEKQKKPGWVPAASHNEPLPAIKKVVAKLPGKGMTLVEVLQHPGGRPRKMGKVHRTTTWRRKKEEVIQGVSV